MDRHDFIVDLKGGLGNQLFQVAFGFLLKQKHPDARIRYNTSYFRRDSRHGGVLAHAVLAGLESTYVELGMASMPAASIDVSEQPGSYLSWLESVRPPARFSGYFQNWQYVAPVLDSMREQSRVLGWTLPGQRWNDILGDESIHTIGVHIRRGDYLLPNVRDWIGVVDLNAILAQVEHIVRQQTRHGRPCVALVVSDMPAETLGELKLSCGCLQVHLGCTDKIQEDLLQFSVLSRCQSMVCSNSTFSYWASLLGKPELLAHTYLPQQWMLKGNVSAEKIRSPSMQLYPNSLN